MCGIVGFIDKKYLNKNVLESMMDKIVHRGPDGSGVYLDESIALGHRRLSIIDAAGGIQPMKNENGSLICVFNGEIYNYRQLRMELKQKGHVFATESDTEVLLHGYEEWKKELPNKLRGMFAFAIWDKEKRELFCARDNFGIKPFYYYKKDEVLLFGSEIKCFLSHPNFEKRFNREQLELYLTYQYSPGEQTFFENVYKLPPAHYLIWTEDDIKIVRYWTPRFNEDSTKTKAEWEMEIDQAMHGSVKAHEISDVEVASFLSSGIDSSYIASLSKVNKTFTIGYDDKKYDESYYADEFSKTMNVWNKVYRISAEEFWEELPKIQYYMDEPLADAASAALYFLNREAAKHVKVCLSGEGADELFGGYNIYKEPFMCEKYDRLPIMLRRAIGMLAGCFPERYGINFLVRHSKPVYERYIGNTFIFSEKQKRKLMKRYFGKTQPINIVNSYTQTFPSMDEISYMQYTDLHLWLVGDILLKADKMSMANSLELRVPFLDKEVFEIARKLPTKYRVNEKETKIALRGAAIHHIGESNAKREKLGFPVPIRDWLREEPYASLVRESFESSVAEEFFYTKKLLRLLDDHINKKRDNWRQIWCIYVFLIWYKTYFVEK